MAVFRKGQKRGADVDSPRRTAHGEPMSDPTIEEKYNVASEFMGSGDYGSAVKIFEELYATHADELHLWEICDHISTCYAHLGDFEKSNHFAEKAIMKADDPTIAVCLRKQPGHHHDQP